MFILTKINMVKWVVCVFFWGKNITHTAQNNHHTSNYTTFGYTGEILHIVVLLQRTAHTTQM